MVVDVSIWKERVCERNTYRGGVALRIKEGCNQSLANTPISGRKNTARVLKAVRRRRLGVQLAEVLEVISIR
jgi:hypothetical protein